MILCDAASSQDFLTTCCLSYLFFWSFSSLGLVPQKQPLDNWSMFSEAIYPSYCPATGVKALKKFKAVNHLPLDLPFLDLLSGC